MRTFAIFGAGAVGGRLAGPLVKAGLDVTLVARGKAAATIRSQGLTIRGPTSEEVISVRVCDETDEVQPVDCVIVAIKAWQIQEAAKRILPMIGARTLVLPLQNGIEAPARLAKILGPGPVIGGVAFLISWIESPGVIRWIAQSPALTIGHLLPEQVSAVEKLGETLKQAGLRITVSKDIVAALWEKLAFIAPLGGVGAVTRSQVGVFREIPESRGLLQTVIEEVANVARARGIHLPENAVEMVIRKIDGLPPDATSSMHRDIVNRRPSELDDLLGAVLRAAEGTPIDPIISRFLFAALLPQERSARRAEQREASPNH